MVLLILVLLTQVLLTLVLLTLVLLTLPGARLRVYSSLFSLPIAVSVVPR